jgi:hypothetical protein
MPRIRSRFTVSDGSLCAELNTAEGRKLFALNCDNLAHLVGSNPGLRDLPTCCLTGDNSVPSTAL